MSIANVLGALLFFRTVAAVPSSKALLRKHVQMDAAGEPVRAEDLDQDASPLGLNTGYGFYASNINFTQSPTMVTHFFDAKEENIIFLMNHGLSYESNATRCEKAVPGCNDCIKPFVIINSASFRCTGTLDGRTLQKRALLEYYNNGNDTKAMCKQYHLKSNFAVSCEIGGATSMKLERYDNLGAVAETYPQIRIPRRSHRQNKTKFNLVGCLMFSAAYSSWSMLFAQLALQRLQGFDHTLIYDNTPPSTKNSSDYDRALAKLKLWKKHVTRITWASSMTLREEFPEKPIRSLDMLAISEYTTYAHCHFFFRGRANWIANNHVDEFMAVQPNSPYVNVADALRPLGRNVNGLLVPSQQVVVPPTINDYNKNLVKEYVSSAGKNVIDSDNLFFDLAKSGELWHSASPKEWMWEGIYRPDSIQFLDAQGAQPFDVSVVSDPQIGVVTQHIRVDAASFRFVGSAPTMMTSDIWDQYCLKDMLVNHSLRRPFYSVVQVRRQNQHLRYEHGTEQRVKCVYEEMRWVGQFGDCVRQIIAAHGRVPKHCKKQLPNSQPYGLRSSDGVRAMSSSGSQSK